MSNAIIERAASLIRTRGWWCAALVVLPLAMMLPWAILSARQPPTGIRFDIVVACQAGSACPLAGEYAARVRSLAAALLLVLTCVVASAIAARTIWSAAGRPADRVVFGASWLALAAVIAPRILGGDKLYRHFGTTFHDTLGAVHDGMPLAVLDRKILIANVVAIVAATGLSVAATSIAAQSRRLALVNRSAVGAQTRLDTVLYASALVLAAGIIDVSQWYDWPLPFMSKTSGAAFKELTSAFLAFQSVCYVAVLVCIYVPAALIIAGARAATGDEPPAHAGTLLGFSWASAGRVASMLSPVIVGPLVSLAQVKLSSG